MSIAVRNGLQSKATQLRALLQREGPVLVVGAHDAISAKLIERAGFDAVWVSSFGVSAAQKCLPDANVLTMTESLDVAKNVNAAIEIPVIADCDNGYGNAINLIRTVTEYEQSGIASVSVEDSEFPKRCSLYPGASHALVSVEEMVGRIRAAKAVQQTPDFLFIARVEALIAGLGQEEALKRARAYAQAGADAILIHSKSSASDEIKMFAKNWDQSQPLVVVPTMFPTATSDELHAAGFKIVIFANHPLRASIKAMREQLATLQTHRSAASVKHQITTLEEVYELVGVDELREQERRFIPTAPATEAASAVILAAGFEPQLMPLIGDRPKAMLDIRGRSILERQIELLHSCGIQSISVVRGYKKERITLPGLRYFDNDRYAEQYILRSLFTAEEALQERVLVLYGDTLFDRNILTRLLASRADMNVVMDRAWTDLARQQTEPIPLETELIMTKEPPIVGRRFLPLDEPGTVIRIGQQIDPLEACGEFTGMMLFSPRGIERFRSAYHQWDSTPTNGNGHTIPDLDRASPADLLQTLIDQGQHVASVDIYKGWLEIDTFDDYRKAWAQVKD